MKKKIKFAFVGFFQVFPSFTGASEVSSSFFNYWPNKNKKFFQFVYKKYPKNKNVTSVKIKNEKALIKLINISTIVERIFSYLKDSKNKILIIEGVSWAGYCYILANLLKKRMPDLVIIYHSHNIEYDLRKSKNNFIISFLTKIFEKKLFLNSNISTVVSKFDAKRVYKLYNYRPMILENGVDVNSLIPNKKLNYDLPKKYIFFNGSYLYKPNKEAIDLLMDYILPKLINYIPNIKLVICGGGINRKINKKTTINLNIVTKNDLATIIKKSRCLVVPLKQGFGTRIKILEALILGCKVITTKKGIEGIDQKFKNSAFKIATNIDKLIKYVIEEFNKQNKNSKSIKYYKSKYSMKYISQKFYYDFFKKNKLI